MVQPVDVFTEGRGRGGEDSIKEDSTNDANNADLQPLDPHEADEPIGDTVLLGQGHPEDQDHAASSDPIVPPTPTDPSQPQPTLTAATGDSSMTRRFLLEEEQRRIMALNQNHRSGAAAAANAAALMHNPAQFARFAVPPQQLIGNPRFMMTAPMAIHPQNPNFFLSQGAGGQTMMPAPGTAFLHPSHQQAAAFANGAQPAFMAAHPQMMAMGMNHMMPPGISQMDHNAMAAFGMRPIDIPIHMDDNQNHHNKPDEMMDRKRSPSPEMPIRPLSAYNFFFSDERERILKENETGVKVKEDNEDLDVKKQRLLEQHLAKDRSRRRPHRKTHGKIGFTTLSKEIGKRWRALPEEKRSYYREIAAMDMDRYQRSVAEYNNERLSKRTRR